MNILKRCGCVLVIAGCSLLLNNTAWAWGDEGHEVIGTIAAHYLTPRTRSKVNELLAGDMSGLTYGKKDIATESTWADKYRDSDRNSTKQHYNRTHKWHFADMEMDGGSLDEACHHWPALEPGELASNGTPNDCVVNKLKQFLTELKAKSTDIDERRLALLFVLHFVGDCHQPLHVSDHEDSGGNQLKVVGMRNLHHAWDDEFVKNIAPEYSEAAEILISKITKANIRDWQKGSLNDWALQSHQESIDVAYGELDSLDVSEKHRLSDTYRQNAQAVTELQLSRAGVRLAFLLNDIFDAGW